MALAFTRFPWWILGGKDREPSVSANSPLNSSSDFGLGMREPDSVKFPSVKGTQIHSSSRRVKKKWQSREERRIDREYDLVLVPSDGGCLSGSESDDSDWSIGWLEPHAPDFLSDDEGEGSFAVLVPCYGRGCNEMSESPKNKLLGAIVSANLTDGYSSGLCTCYGKGIQKVLTQEVLVLLYVQTARDIWKSGSLLFSIAEPHDFITSLALFKILLMSIYDDRKKKKRKKSERNKSSFNLLVSTERALSNARRSASSGFLANYILQVVEHTKPHLLQESEGRKHK